MEYKFKQFCHIFPATPVKSFFFLILYLVLKCTLLDISIVSSAFFWLVFACCIFFHITYLPIICFPIYFFIFKVDFLRVSLGLAFISILTICPLQCFVRPFIFNYWYRWIKSIILLDFMYFLVLFFAFFWIIFYDYILFPLWFISLINFFCVRMP